MLTLFWYKIEQVVKCAIETLNVDLTLPLCASAVLPYNAPGNNTEGNDGDYCWLVRGGGNTIQYNTEGNAGFFSGRWRSIGILVTFFTAMPRATSAFLSRS